VREAYEKELNHNNLFFYICLGYLDRDDLLVRLNLPLELNFLCVGLSNNFDLVILSCIMCTKILWLASICGDFLILFKKIEIVFSFIVCTLAKVLQVQKKSVYFWS
jgi:hypothetical protein